jgi:hypothetical protein
MVYPNHLSEEQQYWPNNYFLFTHYGIKTVPLNHILWFYFLDITTLILFKMNILYIIFSA